MVGMSLEFPRDRREPGESPAEGACRELSEETGYAVPALAAKYLGKIAPDTATLNLSMDVFLVDIPEFTLRGSFDADEIAAPLRLSEQEFLRAIRDGMTLAAWTLAQAQAQVPPPQTTRGSPRHGLPGVRLRGAAGGIPLTLASVKSRSEFSSQREVVVLSHDEAE